jgi:hypothetical protein
MNIRQWKLSDASEVLLADDSSFLKIKETLTRIGIANDEDNTLIQTAHILHKRGRYYIVHFKLLFALDGQPSDFNKEDYVRQNTIANLLQQWKLLKMVDNSVEVDTLPMMKLKVLGHKEKDDWTLVTRYSTLGKNTAR